MAASGRRVLGSFGDLLCRRASPPRQFPLRGFQSLNHVAKLEEENWEWYSPDEFYPVRIGDLFASRYQVLGKLGYGAHSTVWLCRDRSAHKYLTMKVCVRDSKSAQRELSAYEHLNSIKTAHPGVRLVRHLLDSFKIRSTSGEHTCLIHEPLAISLQTFQKLMPNSRLSLQLLKAVLKHVLLALDFLHSEARMIHTDLQARNIQFGVEDDTIFQYFEKHEVDTPSSRKIVNGCVIYESRGLELPSKMGRPILCDMGESRHGKPQYSDDIQPYLYRAPEVILDVPWTYSVDIWNVGILAWHLLADTPLFTASGPEGHQSSKYHLAEMVSALGPPPLDFLRRSNTSWQYFNVDGEWNAATPIPDRSIESLETNLDGQSNSLFLKFIRRTLQWTPEKRPTAKQLLDDPWLHS